MNSMLLIGLGIAALIVVAVLLFTPESGADPKTINRRLERIQGASQAPAKTGQVNVRRYQIDSGIPWLNALLPYMIPHPDKLRARLERTGKNISIGNYALMNGLMIALFYLLSATLFGQSPLKAILIGIAAGLFLPHSYISMLGNARVKAFVANFPEAIDTMTRGLRSGLPISETIASAGREMPDPVGFEFRAITAAVKLGKPLEDAMWETARRIDAPEFSFLIIAMTIQKETGGNLAETLGNLSELLRKRRQMRLKIRALSSEARASALILGSLPFVMFLILFLVNRDYMLTLITTSAGHKLIIIALALMGIGHGIMAKMVRFEI